MAITVASISTLAFGSSSSLVITKPTGLAVGDLMIAHIVVNTSGGSNQSITAPAGWTLINQAGATGSSPFMKSFSFYIIATSTETAASDFTFTVINQTPVSSGGAILRITGHGASTPIDTSTTGITADSASISFTGATPSFENSMLILLAAGNITGGDATVSTYAVETSNPSWTEQYDYNHAGNNICMSCAVAIRPENTATGNASFATTGGSSTDIAAQFIIIRPTDSNFNATVLAVTVSLQASVTVGGANFDTSVLSLGLNIQAPVVSINPWNNQSKNSISMSNQSKNAVSFANQSKNSPTWGNQSKT